MCTLLAARPRVARGVVLRAAGPKFVDLFVRELGVEQRVYVDKMFGADKTRADASKMASASSWLSSDGGQAVREHWCPEARVLTLSLRPPAAGAMGFQAPPAADTLAPTVEHAVLPAADDASTSPPVVCDSLPPPLEFDPLRGVENAASLVNPHGLAPLSFPLELRSFGTMPVVVSAMRSPSSGRWVDVAVRPYVAGAASP